MLSSIVCCGVTPGGGGTVLDLAVSALWLLTPLTATLSLVIMCVAMGTNQWLHSEERMPNSNYNGTGERTYLSKHTVSGLWTLCYTNLPCIKIV
ncbi:hypothetical protein B566_EDAN003723 [Ephemera danica]|nr:hypothetical protein B566_EDAN003723 [Ephemera danica]